MGNKIVERIRHFYQRNIICHFGLPKITIFDNEMQLSSSSVKKLCSNLGICTKFISIEDPWANGQEETINKFVLSSLKKKLDEANGLWNEQIYVVLWLYHKTPNS